MKILSKATLVACNLSLFAGSVLATDIPKEICRPNEYKADLDKH